MITPSESIFIYSWIIINFQKHACFQQFVWACYNIFASCFCFGFSVQNLYFHLIAFILSQQVILSLFEFFQFYARTSHPLKKIRLVKSGSLYLGHFQAVEIETTGVYGKSTAPFLSGLSKKLVNVSGDPKEHQWLHQRLSLAVTRGNAASILTCVQVWSDFTCSFSSCF